MSSSTKGLTDPAFAGYKVVDLTGDKEKSRVLIECRRAECAREKRNRTGSRMVLRPRASVPTLSTAHKWAVAHTYVSHREAGE